MNGTGPDVPVSPHERTGAAGSIAIGALLAGIADAADASLFSYLYRGVPPGRVWQSVASGALGRAAFDGGTSTVALGLAIHFFIATCVVATYVFASRRWPELARRWVALGTLYGIGVYAFMNLVVIPMSAIGPVRPTLPAFINGILIHIVGIGMPSGWAAARAARRSARGRLRGIAMDVRRDGDPV